MVKSTLGAIVVVVFAGYTQGSALAACVPGLGCGVVANPEIDGPAGVAAIAMLASVVALLWRRNKS